MNCELTLRLPSGLLRTLHGPQVMGILNVTAESFYAISQCPDLEAVEARVRQMLDEGADIIDIGGCSTRPGSQPPTPAEELRRVALGIDTVKRLASPDMLISVDTYRPEVALMAVKMGAHIINDVHGTHPEPGMITALQHTHAPYILTHSRGQSADMQSLCQYGDVVADVASELSAALQRLNDAGISDVIIDPGIGFAKTVEQNYRLLSHLTVLRQVLRRPLLVGLSRKSFIYRPLGLGPDDVLPATCALNTLALQQGTAILRVHDVAAARQCISAMLNAQCSMLN